MRAWTIGCVLTVLAASTGLMGCPPAPAPPFNATGLYSGTWTEADVNGKETECAITLEIQHNIAESFPRNFGIEVTLNADLSCTPQAQNLVDAGISTQLAIPLLGALDLRGQFILVSEPCEAVRCTAVIVGGEGFAENGVMTAAEGAFTVVIEDSGEVLMELAADFAVTRD